MAAPILIGVEQNKFIKDSNTKMKTLFVNNGYLDNNYLSGRDETNTDYQVPVGKKFVILEISFVGAGSGTGALQWHIGYSTTANSGTGYNIFMHMQCLQTQPFTIRPYSEIAAGNYITFYGQANSFAPILTGVELDA